MQATIEIDLGQFTSEWEVVAVRTPKEGEFYWYRDHAVQSVDDWTSEPMIIVRRKWTFPSWLKARWYYECSNGVRFVSCSKPYIDNRQYWVHTDAAIPLGEMFDIPKIGGDWRQSLRENPNWKASQE